MDDEVVIRKINLIQVYNTFTTIQLTRHGFALMLTDDAHALPAPQILQEDADADGLIVPELPDSAAREWSESQIRQHFAGADQQALPADGNASALKQVLSCRDEPDDRSTGCAWGWADELLCWRSTARHLMRHRMETSTDGSLGLQPAELRLPRRGSGSYASLTLAMPKTCTPAKALASGGRQAHCWCASRLLRMALQIRPLPA